MGLLTGNEPTRFVAGQASVGSDTLDATDYQLTESSWHNLSREVSVGPVTREIQVANYVNGYERRRRDGTSAGGFAVLSTPQAKILGQAVNPVGDWSHERLLSELQSGFSSYGKLKDVSETDTRSASILGSTTDVTVFSATGVEDGGDSESVVIQLARVSHQGDYIVAASIRAANASSEQPRLNELFAGIVHEAATQTVDDSQPPKTVSRQSINGFYAPTVDGVLYGETGQKIPEGRAAEWSDGKSQSVMLRTADGQTHEGTLYTKYVGEDLYVGVHVPGLRSSAVRRASLVVDRNGDGKTSVGDGRVTLRRASGRSDAISVQSLSSDGYVPARGTTDGGDGALAERTAETASAAVAGDGRDGTVFEARVTPAQLDTLLGERGGAAGDKGDSSTRRTAAAGDDGEGVTISYTVELETTQHVFVVNTGTGGNSPVIGPGGVTITDLIDNLILDIPGGSSIPGGGSGTTPPHPRNAHVEVFQTVQNRSNDMPLVRGKDTLVRAFIEHDGPNPIKTDVTATVYNVTGGAYQRTGSAVDRYDAPPVPDRTNWDHAANLEFRGSAFDHEAVLVEIEFTLYPDGYSGPGFIERTVWKGGLNETYEPTVYYLRVRNTSRNTTQVPQWHADLIEKRYRQLYPIGDMQFVDVGWEALGNFTQGSGSQLIGSLDQVAATISAGNLSSAGPNPAPVDQVFGVTRRGGGLSDPAWGNGNSRAAWGGLWSSSGGFVMAHEMEHNVGNNTFGRHVGDGKVDDRSTPNVDESTSNGCGASGTDARWSQLYPTNIDTHEVGWNPTDDWVTADYPDVMSYCMDSDPRKWISTYRWVRLFERFEGFQAGQPIHPDLQSGGGSSGSAPDAARRPAAEVFGRRVPTVRVVTGTLTPEGTGSLDTTFEQPGHAPTDRPTAREPTAVLVVRYASGDRLRIPVGSPSVDSEGDPVDSWPFTVTVPDGGLVESIRLETLSGRVLDSQRDSGWELAGGNLDTPTAFERGQTAQVHLHTEGVVHRDLATRLLYTPDGERYYPYGPTFSGSSYPATFTGLPGGDRAHFLLLVSDGLRTHFVESDAFRVPHRPPTVDILGTDRLTASYDTTAPRGDNAVDGSVRVRNEGSQDVRAVAGGTVSIGASAHDERGAPLGGEQLQWRATDERGRTVARDTGESFTHQFTTPGTYEVTITGRADGQSASDSVRVVVDPPTLPSAAEVAAFQKAITARADG